MCAEMTSGELNDEDNELWKTKVLGPSKKEPSMGWLPILLRSKVTHYSSPNNRRKAIALTCLL